VPVDSGVRDLLTRIAAGTALAGVLTGPFAT
jgi:hypothetical protein